MNSVELTLPSSASTRRYTAPSPSACLPRRSTSTSTRTELPNMASIAFPDRLKTRPLASTWSIPSSGILPSFRCEKPRGGEQPALPIGVSFTVSRSRFVHRLVFRQFHHAPTRLRQALRFGAHLGIVLLRASSESWSWRATSWLLLHVPVHPLVLLC